MKTRYAQRKRRHARVRARISGTTEVPRLNVHRSNKYLFVQLIDDTQDKTLLGMTDKAIDGKTKEEKAAKLGEAVAAKAKEQKIEKVVFDRGGYAYLGRVKSFAEGARKGGLKF